MAQPVRLILIGGFLGAGKTSTLLAAACHLAAAGARVALITNDQAADLVDTALVRQAGLPVAEVPDGCFCCRFDDLLAAVDALAAVAPEAILAEPVGSCTDLAATVAAPLRCHHADRVSVAPLTVVVDPARVAHFLLGEAPPGFSADVAYLFRQQLLEADVVLLNKVDTLTNTARERLLALLAAHCAGARVLPLSATTGEGVPAWLATLAALPGPSRPLADLDYDRYAAAEAELGWYNAVARVAAPEPFDLNELASGLARGIADELARDGAPLAHLKVFARARDGEDASTAKVVLVTGQASPDGTRRAAAPTRAAELLINLRAAAAPNALRSIVAGALADAAGGATWHLERVRAFRPAYPRPQYREGT